MIHSNRRAMILLLVLSGTIIPISIGLLLMAVSRGTLGFDVAGFLLGIGTFMLQWMMDDRPPPVHQTGPALAPAGA